MIVDSREKLKITGVVDFEWSYTGPAQLLGTAPWWLLQERPELWDFSPDMRDRFLRHLGLFKRVLEEEEKHAPEYQSKKLSELVERSETEWTMWYHMILQGSFHGPGSLLWEQLKGHTPDWDLLAAGIPEEDIRSFVAAKMEHLKLHVERLKKTETTYDEMLESGPFKGLSTRSKPHTNRRPHIHFSLLIWKVPEHGLRIRRNGVE